MFCSTFLDHIGVYHSLVLSVGDGDLEELVDLDVQVSFSSGAVLGPLVELVYFGLTWEPWRNFAWMRFGCLPSDPEVLGWLEMVDLDSSDHLVEEELTGFVAQSGVYFVALAVGSVETESDLDDYSLVSATVVSAPLFDLDLDYQVAIFGHSLASDR